MTPQERQRQYSREYRARRPDANRKKNEVYRARNPDKQKAHKAVEIARRAGRIVRQPCERCGATSLVHAHHDDYARLLDVIWLCPVHHRERHQELKVMSRAA